MIKKIETSDLLLGMYIHALCGNWIDHPFWKERFLLNDPQDILRIQRSAISEVMIDTSKGRDVKTQPVVVNAPAAGAPAASSPEPVKRVAMDAEMSRAIKICTRAKAAVTSMFNDARMGLAISTSESEALVEEISTSVLRHPHALISLSRLKTSDEYTYMHSVAVCALMMALARQLSLPEAWVREAGIAGLMHDIGKMTIGSDILNKPGRLTDPEFAAMRLHPEGGVKILQQSGILSAAAYDVCLHHHEKFDGTGYPFGLEGEQISVFARMAAICDVYDAITSERPYKKAWGPAHSIREMASWAGHFDEQIFQAFVRTVGIYPVGALVRLNSQRIGVVVEQDDKSLLRPKVMMLLSARTKMPLERKVLDLSRAGEEDKIIRIESAKDWNLGDIDAIWTGRPGS
jgi:putative nucleotidyltransferase with HDIG domain